jgi:two-component system chemotaxis sensor kinase CheA
MVSVKTIFYDFFTSGKSTREGGKLTSEFVARYALLNSAHILGGVILFIYGLTVLFIEQDFTRSMLDFALAFICLLVIIVLRSKIPYKIPGTFSLSAFGALCAFFLYNGEIGGFGSLWFYAFPLMVIFTLGLFLGIILSTLLLIAICAITLIPGFAGIEYSVFIGSRLAGSYVLVTSLAVIYEVVRLTKDRNIAELTKNLQVERDEVSAMKDTLKTGVFLMDNDLLIQPSYSKSMEKILSTDEIQGKKFTDFLGPSMSKRELDALIKYFEMVIKRAFNAKMLEEINPIPEFIYKDEDNPYGEEKHLRTSFTTVDRGDGVFMIQGTLDDISNQVRLQKELEAEAAKRDDEMQTLFQIVQLEPSVFDDFIIFIENEFNEVNNILKSNDISTNAEESMNAIFRRVHSIKSMAFANGMESFGNKLHELEIEIRAMQNRGKVTFDDTLHTVVRLEAIMEEKDKYRKTVSRISSFRESQSRPVSSKFILIDTLTKICERSGQEEGKEVTFASDDFDEAILDSSTLSIIKETLTQLVRNAVAHGIETPNERKTLGKNPKGKIHLSVKQADNKIHLKIVDDGAGIDFDKIRKKAKSLNLLKDNVSDNNTLIKFLFDPGFTTADKVSTTAGQGVGLDLVRDRIKELNGSIKVVTKKGKGTAFNLIVPAKNNK